jgi:isoleucyl-tRNA synthetase
MKYPEYPKSQIDLEEEILALWRAEDLFHATLKATEGGEEFVFFEGPPTANGRPGIHHVLSRTIKDLVARYRTMRGMHVTRIAGWDTHGLPVEIEAEKRLGISGKRQIEELGVAKFNEVCRESVFTYKEDWERLSERIGYWLDYSRPYITFTPTYIESVWWILKQLDDKDLIYKGYKSVPYCPRCGTALSSHEVAQGYEDVRDPSLYFSAPWQHDPEGRAFLVWTTTPWTLPSNIALAVHPDLAYVEVEHDGQRLVLAESRAAAIFGDDVQFTRRYTAGELVGQRYERPFDIVPAPRGAEEAWRVIAEEFVTADDGTGIVHMAPAFGADDLAAGQKHGLPMLRPIDDAGRFEEGIPLVGGQFVKDADRVLLDDLEQRGITFRYSLESHSYPHCWRCGSPLVYMARDSWYIRTTAMKDVMIENNNRVQWHPPEVGTGRFGEWLAGNVDWALSRERYWGTPLPIWVCDEIPDHREFIGSFAQLAARAGDLGSDFDPHKPHIDELTWACEQCKGTMRRTPEVIDVWFDSGSMPYAQWHYPFENADVFKSSFPADFICEAIDQTRGWFYTLHAIATMVSDQAAYKNVICLGLIVDQDGKKMSKSLGNIINPYDVFDAVGADALRWHFTARVAPDVTKRVSVDIIADVASSFINTFWNTYAFFVMYARLDGFDRNAQVPYAQRPEIDRWILSLLEQTIATATAALDDYDALRAGAAIESFVDQLSNWYVRRNRRRFWKAASGADKQAAYLTLYECLEVVNRLLAPFVPFISEAVHQNLVRAIAPEAPVSVHMASWPESEARRLDRQLLAETDVVQRVVGLGRAARNSSKLKVRQPLKRLLIRVPDAAAEAAVRRHEDQILDELNVKRLELIARDATLVSYRIKPNLPVIGKRYGKLIPAIRAHLATADGAAIAAAVARGEQQTFVVNGQSLAIEPADLLVESAAAEGFACAEEGGYLAGLDTTLDDALRREGLARELIRAVQDARKQAGLEVADRIVLCVEGDAAVAAALAEHRDYLMTETLASTWGKPASGEFVAVQDQGEAQWVIRLAREPKAGAR